MDNKSKEKITASLYAELLRYEQVGDYDRGFKVCNKILGTAPDDRDAFSCKVICLVLSGQFEEALKLTKKNSHLSQGLEFEIAYSLYRLNRTQEAHDILQNYTPTDEMQHRIDELRCQIYYRLDRYQEAADRYGYIFKEYEDDEYQDERATNLSAAAVFLDPNNGIGESISDDNYEVCFNKALMYARRNDLTSCDKYLKKCETLMKDSLDEEGASEEEIQSEMANIKALQAYCLQKRGQNNEAHRIYSDILKNKHEDPSLNIVASNNIAVINKDQNIFDSRKKLKVAKNDVVLQKMPSEQKQYILLNNAVFHYITNQHDQCLKITQDLEKLWPDAMMDVTILGILCKAKQNSKIDPVIELLKYKAKNSNEELFVKLACVQLLLTQGNKAKACEVLESLKSFRYKPAIVGALITLYLSQGKEDVALKIYEESIEWYKTNKKSGMDLSGFFAQAATFHIRSGRPEVAVKSLEQLLTHVKQGDNKTVAQLVLAYAQFDESKVTEFESKLGSLKDFEKEVDVANLESATWLTKKQAASLATPKEASPGTPINKTKKKKKNKRRGKLPKNYDPNVAPDPERWLPKYERTGFRKKRDRRMKDVIKGSQGTASGQSEQFDYSKVSVEQDESIDPSPAQKGGARQKRPAQKKKNKRR